MATGTDVAVFVGLQASGKSTFYAQRLSGRYALVGKDLFPRGARNKQRRQMRLVAEHLAAGRPVAVDNTNPSPHEWAPLVELAHAHGATATAYWFPPDAAGSLRRNAAREGRDRVPDVGVLATLGKLRRPSTEDGFDTVHEVRFDGRGGFEVRAGTPHGPGAPGNPRTRKGGATGDGRPAAGDRRAERPNRWQRCGGRTGGPYGQSAGSGRPAHHGDPFVEDPTREERT